MTTKQLKMSLICLIFGMMFTTTQMKAQALKINPRTSTMTILGTTNVHNFETKVTQISGELIINSDKKVEKLSVQIPVKSIKSAEKLMDTKTYEAFNAEKNPNISFQLTDATSVKLSSKEIEATVIGNLTMAGTTKKIVFKATGVSTKQGLFEFKGSIPLKMTDFKMSPPTAMMGMMRVGDVITLKYDIYLEGNQQISALLDK